MFYNFDRKDNPTLQIAFDIFGYRNIMPFNVVSM